MAQPLNSKETEEMKILIIEDELVLGKSIKNYLEKDNNKCELATDFEDAWMKVGLYEYDCLMWIHGSAPKPLDRYN